MTRFKVPGTIFLPTFDVNQANGGSPQSPLFTGEGVILERLNLLKQFKKIYFNVIFKKKKQHRIYV